MDQLIKGFDFGCFFIHALALVLLDRFGDHLIVMRNDLFEERQIFREAVEDPSALFAAGGSDVFFDQSFQFVNITLCRYLAAGDQFFVQTLVKVVVLVKDIRHAARHARGKVFTGSAEDDDLAARHVFAAVLTDALDDCRRAGIAYAEALAGNAVDERLAACRAVKGDVADDDVFLRLEAAALGRIDGQLAAGKSLAELVVAVAAQLHGQAVRNERTEALTA